MSEKRITFRINMDKYAHRLAYDIYLSIPTSQRSDYIRLAMILMHDRDKQAKRMREMLMRNKQMPNIGILDAPLEDTAGGISRSSRAPGGTKHRSVFFLRSTPRTRCVKWCGWADWC